HKPLAFWLMIFSFETFGLSEFSVRIPSILLSTLAVYFTYGITKRLYGKKTGLIAAFFHAINGLIIEMCAGRTATDHYDTLFLVFIEGAIYFAILQIEKRKLIYSLIIGLFIGCAILTKWLPAFIVFPVWYLFSKKYFSRNKLIVQGVLMLLVT